MVIVHESSNNINNEDMQRRLTPPPVPPRPDKLNRKKKINDKIMVSSNDLKNHELLIDELQKKCCANKATNLSNYTINHSNWYEVEDNGNEIQYSRCQIIIDNNNFPNDNDNVNQLPLSASTPNISARNELMLLNGLPPLPKCLSNFSSRTKSRGFEQKVYINNGSNTDTLSSSTNGTYHSSSLSSISSTTSSSDLLTFSKTSEAMDSLKLSQSSSLTGLNKKFAFLKNEMNCLRQLDLSLLSQLWTLNESIQEFRALLMDQDQELLQNSVNTTKITDFDGDDIYHI